jgi:hypothetical protein
MAARELDHVPYYHWYQKKFSASGARKKSRQFSILFVQEILPNFFSQPGVELFAAALRCEPVYRFLGVQVYHNHSCFCVDVILRGYVAGLGPLCGSFKVHCMTHITDQPFPAPNEPRIVERSEYKALHALGLRIEGELDGNIVCVHPDFKSFHGDARIDFTGSGSRVYIDQACCLRGEISFPDGNGQAWIFSGQPHLNLTAGIYGGSSLVWGFGSTAFGVRVWVHGERTISVGQDCLFSEGIEIRSSDHHAVIDLDAEEQVNFPSDVRIGAHVWVGPGAMITKGVSIGDGAIIGARSLVNRPVPSCELWAGSPARRVRENTSWSACHSVSKDQILAVKASVRP